MTRHIFFWCNSLLGYCSGCGCSNFLNYFCKYSWAASCRGWDGSVGRAGSVGSDDAVAAAAGATESRLPDPKKFFFHCSVTIWIISIVFFGVVFLIWDWVRRLTTTISTTTSHDPNWSWWTTGTSLIRTVRGLRPFPKKQDLFSYFKFQFETYAKKKNKDEKFFIIISGNTWRISWSFYVNYLELSVLIATNIANVGTCS